MHTFKHIFENSRVLLSGRDKDLSDIEALLATLGIKNRKQAEALLRRYIEKKTLNDYAQEIQITLNTFFE